MKKIAKTKWHCIYNPGRQGFDLFLLTQFGDGNSWFNAQDITLVERKDFGDYPNPLLTLDENQAQQLMDALWAGGLRPTEGHGSAGQIGAVERHLEDMRKIVFEAFLSKL